MPPLMPQHFGQLESVYTGVMSAIRAEARQAEEQTAVAEEINRNVVNISQAVSDTTQGAEHTAQASDELARPSALPGDGFPSLFLVSALRGESNPRRRPRRNFVTNCFQNILKVVFPVARDLLNPMQHSQGSGHG